MTCLVISCTLQASYGKEGCLITISQNWSASPVYSIFLSIDRKWYPFHISSEGLLTSLFLIFHLNNPLKYLNESSIQSVWSIYFVRPVKYK